MLNPLKLIKSKPAFDKIEANVEQIKMNPTNWRTSISGIAVGVLMLASVWAPQEYQDKIQKTQSALIMIGLITAADSKNLKK